MYYVGVMTVSPSGLTPVCCGDQLELICSTRTVFLEWRFIINSRATTTVNRITYYMKTLATGSIEDNGPQLTVDSVVFSFSRISAEDVSPVTCRLMIGPVSVSFNEARIYCVDVESKDVTTLIILNSVECQYPGT